MAKLSDYLVPRLTAVTVVVALMALPKLLGGTREDVITVMLMFVVFMLVRQEVERLREPPEQEDEAQSRATAERRSMRVR